MNSPGTKYLDPLALAKLKNLGLAARLVVEGLYAGQHRSPHKGFSVEFAEHRQYVPGDETRYLDWKLLAKRDRLYLKQYEEQTSLRCHLVVDASRSMAYHHSGTMTKLEYACYSAASLAFLMQSQHDAYGLTVCDTQVRLSVPPRQGKGHLQAVMQALESITPAGETDLPAALHSLAEGIRRRGLVVVLSDCFSGGTDPRALLDALVHLRHRKHEVIVLQVLDPAELEFPFTDAGQIEDLESGRLVTADAEAVRRHYLESIGRYLDALRLGCQSRQIGYALADTAQPFHEFLAAYLSRRQALGRANVG
ncbi:MAG TPA: DUF58 domain-containing protein [Pirellulales bacterium]|nr:DUF58 domain-containing protein [Pirellulales bacterium]